MTSRDATFAVWALLGAAAVVLAALAMVGRGGVARPSTLLQPHLTAHGTARIVAVLAWMWLGWHLFAR